MEGTCISLYRERKRIQAPDVGYKSTINEINQLATDGFKIEITDNLTISNIILYLCNKERVKELNPEFYKKISDLNYDIAGYVSEEALPKTYEINKAEIFISTENSIDIQESTILEEITQSLGLTFDSKKYETSVFYEDKYELEEIKQYSQLDKDIIIPSKNETWIGFY